MSLMQLAPGLRALRTLLSLGALLMAGASIAAPEVEGVDLVSSQRFDRTKFDYTYSLRVRVDAVSYSAGRFTVTSTAPATMVLTSRVTLPALDAGSFVRSTNTFTVRHDRTVPFDASALRFAFAGIAAPITVGGARIGAVQFMEMGGRPVHEGLFPIQQSNPTAGSTITLWAAIDGPAASATYRLSTPLGVVLASGSLIRAAMAPPVYEASLIVPSSAFRITVDSVALSGQVTSWTSSRTYSPSGFQIAFKPASALLQKGETVSASIEIRSATDSGWRKVWLLLPGGFAANAGPWDVFLAPGTVSTITTSITAPTTGGAYVYYTLGAALATALSVADATVADQTFIVE